MGKGFAPISDPLRRAIAEAIDSGQTTYLALERETGVTRASIMRFVKGTRTLRLDMADRLAKRFGLILKASSER
jgi:plasmid maintenance system antidote protein VapI